MIINKHASGKSLGASTDWNTACAFGTWEFYNYNNIMQSVHNKIPRLL